MNPSELLPSPHPPTTKWERNFLCMSISTVVGGWYGLICLVVMRLASGNSGLMNALAYALVIGGVVGFVSTPLCILLWRKNLIAVLVWLVFGGGVLECAAAYFSHQLLRGIGPNAAGLYISVAAYALSCIGLRFTLKDDWHRPGHCPKCSYNLKGNTSGICPECGTSPIPNDALQQCRK